MFGWRGALCFESAKVFNMNQLLKNLFVGRIGRKKFILFELLILVIGFGMWILIQILPSLFDIILLAAFIILAFTFSLGLCVKRIHDIGNSTWWLILLFVPIIDTGMAIYLSVHRGENGPNAYGEKVM